MSYVFVVVGSNKKDPFSIHRRKVTLDRFDRLLAFSLLLRISKRTAASCHRDTVVLGMTITHSLDCMFHSYFWHHIRVPCLSMLSGRVSTSSDA